MLDFLLLLAIAQPAPLNAAPAPASERAPARFDGVPVGKGKTLPKVTIQNPPGGWTVDRMILVEGTVSDTTIDPIVISINGDRYLLRTAGGRFSRKFPASAGKNVITVLATNQAGTSKAQVTCMNQVPSVPLKAILTSDTDGVYTDLHIYEPSDKKAADGSLDVKAMPHVFWAQTESPTGGTFFLNEQGGNFDQPGYGPYLYIHRAPPKGVFAIVTNYWPSGDKAHTLATLNVTLFEGTPEEIRRMVRVPLATPGTTKVLAWINVIGPGRALVYVPGQDHPPTGELWPRSLDSAAEQLVAASGGGGGGGFGD
jgi:uncharacterized protein YfaP (DUF2135 family)